MCCMHMHSYSPQTVLYAMLQTFCRPRVHHLSAEHTLHTYVLADVYASSYNRAWLHCQDACKHHTRGV